MITGTIQPGSKLGYVRGYSLLKRISSRSRGSRRLPPGGSSPHASSLWRALRSRRARAPPAPGRPGLGGRRGGRELRGRGPACPMASPGRGAGRYFSHLPGPRARSASGSQYVARAPPAVCASFEGKQALGRLDSACRLHVYSAHQSGPVRVAEGAGAPRGKRGRVQWKLGRPGRGTRASRESGRPPRAPGGRAGAAPTRPPAAALDCCAGWEVAKCHSKSALV